MKPRYTHNILRLLVLAGCIPLLQRGRAISIVRAQAPGEVCGTFQAQVQTQCPASCNTGTYTDWYSVGSGFEGASVNPTPCAGASCVQPFTYAGALPFAPQGCFAHAWTVAEVLSSWITVLPEGEQLH
jgi:hypothetical protein